MNNEEYEVERILDCRTVNGKREYLIKWKEYDAKFNTWEPEENLTGCKQLLNRFKGKENKNIELGTLPDSVRDDDIEIQGITKPNSEGSFDYIVKTSNKQYFRIESSSEQCVFSRLKYLEKKIKQKE